MSVRILSAKEAMRELEKHEERMNKIFTHNHNNNTMLVNVIYPYEVDLDRINSERDLLAWVMHLSEKTWVDAGIINEFASRVAKIKGFDIYGC